MTEETISDISIEYLKDIESDLNKATELVTDSKFDEAIQLLNTRIDKSDCSVCKLELNIAIADIKHNQEICVLGSDYCDSEKEVVIAKLNELKEDIKLASV